MNLRRVPELDALRGLAAVGIVLFHYTYHLRAYDLFFYTGAVSLELFFVLSGFLITTIILANVENDGFLWNFYVRRGLRIYPIYYLLIAALLAVHAVRPSIFSLEEIPYDLTYTQHIQRYWFGPEPPAIYPLSHTWSLAVEEQYYILWPVMIGLLGRRMVIPLALTFMGVAVAARGYGFSTQILLGRCDGFALGGLLAAIVSGTEGLQRQPGRLRLAFGLIVLAALNYLSWGQLLLGAKPFSMGHASPAFDFLIVGGLFFAVIGLVIGHAGHRVLSPLRARPLCYLGKISYGMYLYHLPILVFLDRPIQAIGVVNPWGVIALKVAACLAVSAASWKIIEQPILAIKERFRYGNESRRKPVSSPVLTSIEPP